MEDMDLPGAESGLKREKFGKIHSAIPASHLLQFFAVAEFVNVFAVDVFGKKQHLLALCVYFFFIGFLLQKGDEREVGCSKLENWLNDKNCSQELELFICGILTFIMNECDEPRRRLQHVFGDEEEQDEEEDEEDEDEGEEGEPRVVFLARFKKLASHLNPMTWHEVLRRVMYAHRYDLSKPLLRRCMECLHNADFGSISLCDKIEVFSFLVRRCLQSSKLRAIVEQSQTHVANLKSERSKRQKEIRAKYQKLSKTKVPPLPENHPQYKEDKAKLLAKEKEVEKMREDGTERSVVAKHSKEYTQMKKELQELEEKLISEHEEVKFATKHRDEELKELEEELDPQIEEEKACMRVEPLGKDRWHRSFWFFGNNRETFDVVFVYDEKEENVDDRWSMMEDLDAMKVFKNALEPRGYREKGLKAKLEKALTEIEQNLAEEAELLASSRTKRKARKHRFGREKEDVEDSEEEDEEAEKEEKDQSSLLVKMQTHLMKFIQELPKGCVPDDVIESLCGKIDDCKNGSELGSLLLELESHIQSGWLGKQWPKDQKDWKASLLQPLVPLPLFALQMYVLEFAIDRNYNPKLGRSEKAALDKSHQDLCKMCGKPGQLLCCDTCPAVYHMGCLDPPLYHIPRGIWKCPRCERRAHSRKSRRLKSLNEKDLQEAYMGEDDNEGGDDEEEEEEEEEEVGGLSTRRKVRINYNEKSSDFGSKKRRKEASVLLNKDGIDLIKARSRSRKVNYREMADDEDDEDENEDKKKTSKRKNKKIEEEERDFEDEDEDDEDEGDDHSDGNEGEDEEDQDEEEYGRGRSRTRKRVERSQVASDRINLIKARSRSRPQVNYKEVDEDEEDDEEDVPSRKSRRRGRGAKNDDVEEEGDEEDDEEEEEKGKGGRRKATKIVKAKKRKQEEEEEEEEDEEEEEEEED